MERAVPTTAYPASRNPATSPAPMPCDAPVMIATLIAEGEGFEPSEQGLPAQRFSRPPDSTTLAPLRA
jgi:hypothetical protein